MRDLLGARSKIHREPFVSHGVYARRLKPDLSAVGAEMAFCGRAFVRIDVDGIVRASLHTGFTADAAVGTEVNDAVFALIHRGDGADGDAGRILAVIAACDLKHAPRIGIRALLDVLDPRTIYAERNVVLRLAGHRAGVAADTLAVIDDKSVSHSRAEKTSIENRWRRFCILADEAALVSDRIGTRR